MVMVLLMVMHEQEFDQMQLPTKSPKDGNSLILNMFSFNMQKKNEIFLTPTPSPFIETTVKAANNVVITPITNAAGIIAKLIRFKK